MRKLALLFSLTVTLGLAGCGKSEVTVPDTNKECLEFNGRIGTVLSVARVGAELYEVRFRTVDAKHELLTWRLNVSELIIDLPASQVSWVEQRSNGKIVEREIGRGKAKDRRCLINFTVHLSRSQPIVDRRSNDDDLLWLLPFIINNSTIINNY